MSSTLTSASAPKINLDEAATSINQPWSPIHLATLNGNTSFKMAKFSGSFLWHSHPDTDELFYVVSGGPMQLHVATDPESRHERDGSTVVELRSGEMWVVPRGWRHRPVAPDMAETGTETVVLLAEMVGTVNTGDEAGSSEGQERTVLVDEGLEGARSADRQG